MSETTLDNDGMRLRPDLSFTFHRNDLLVRVVEVHVHGYDGSRELRESFPVHERPPVDAPPYRRVTACAGPLEASLDFQLPAQGSHLSLLCSLASRAPGPLRLRSFTMGLEVTLRSGETPQPEEVTWVRNGWQSWSFAGTVSAARPSVPLPRLGFVYGIKEDSAVRRNDAPFVSDMVTAVKLGDNALLAGATEQRFFQRVEVWPMGNRFWLQLVMDLDDVPLQPGGRRDIGGWQFEGERTATGLLRRWGRRHACRPGRIERLTGWCSWYDRYRGITAQYIEENAQRIASTPDLAELRHVVIDDGYQDLVGDWLAPSARFGVPIEAMAGRLAARGLLPGVWLAPFIAQSRSRLVADHPSWLLRREGRALRIGWNPHWRDSFYALDVSNPEFLDHLERLIRRLRRAGFRLFKLDYLFAGALRGERANPGEGRYACYREALGRIREAAGEDAVLLGCGAPLAPSRGLVDVMRVTTDVGYSWEAPDAVRWVTGDRDLVGILPVLRNTLVRSAFSPHFWLTDPDCLLLRRRKGASSAAPEDVALLANLIAQLGSVVLVGDDLTRWQAEERKSLSLVLAQRGRSFAPLDCADRESPAWTEHLHGSRLLVTAHNLGEAQDMFSLALPRLEHRLAVRSATSPTGHRVDVGSERISVWNVDRHRFAVVHVSDQPAQATGGSVEAGTED